MTATGGKRAAQLPRTGLPLGLTLDAAGGRIGGKPWQTGTLPVTVTATDATGATATAAFPLTVNWF